MGNSNYIILNDDIQKNSDLIEDPLQLSNNLQRTILKLKGENIIDEKSIDYSKLVESRLFREDYLQTALNLKCINLNKLAGNDTFLKAFFINVYNSLTIHAISYLYKNDPNLRNDPKSSILTQLQGKFWSKFAYNINGQVYSLDEIEHGILRANSSHPSLFFNIFIARRFRSKMFKENDPRIKLVVQKLDPRIHFALNCGAASCPPIAVYTPENLETGLDLAAYNFINSESRLDLKLNTIELSRIFLWYKADFCSYSTTNESEQKKLLKYIAQYLNREDENLKQQFIKLIDEDRIKILFSSYDWEMNFKH